MASWCARSDAALTLIVEVQESVILDLSGEEPWLEAANSHFWIRYHASDRAVIRDVLQAGAERFNQITTILGYRLLGRVPITLVFTHAELEQQFREPQPAWVPAFALPDSLVILTPRRYSRFLNRHDYADTFELVPHELTHLLIGKIVGYPGFLSIPQWFNDFVNSICKPFGFNFY